MGQVVVCMVTNQGCKTDPPPIDRLGCKLPLVFGPLLSDLSWKQIIHLQLNLLKSIMLYRLSIIGALLASSWALPAQESRLVESTPSPLSWRKIRPASDSAIVHLNIGVKHDENTAEELKRRLLQSMPI